MEEVVLNNRYRLVERIGSGGMAVVYQAVDTLLQRRVAVKVLRDQFAGDPDFLTRFQREARAAANLDHPNIVTVHDVGQDGDRHYIVMEYVDGCDLKTLIRQRERLSIDEALDITTQICEGVGHAHKAGVVHRDIKPQNVLITEDGRAKVVDFGIARALSESGLTDSETVWGSPLYFAPEQAAGESPTPASDVYSIGVVTYEMLAGLPPFRAENPTALAMMHLREEPPPLAVRNPQVPPRLEGIVRKVLAKEPSARYRSAERLAHVLDEYRHQVEQVTGWQPAVSGPEPSVPLLDYATESESVAEPQPGSDVLTWILGAVAFIAVIGLIPLWWLVYRSYAALPTAPPTATPTPLVTSTPDVALASVPDLLDRPREEARRLVRQKGLQFAVVEERQAPDVEEGVVLEQTPAPGESVPLDSTVSVVLSGPGRELTVPNVVGYPVEMIQEGLESDGLEVNVERVWSTEPDGQVLAQEPERGTVIYAGDPVTLTVSGGVDEPIPLEVNLDDRIVLKSAELRQDRFRPGGVVAVTLRWEALRSIDSDYVVFVHLIGPDGGMAAQEDVEPSPPTARWVKGIEVVDPHRLTIPADRPAGRYQLRAGLYPPGRPADRLPVVDAGSTTVDSNSALLAEIEVRP